MTFDTAPRAGRNRRAGDRSARAARDVSGEDTLTSGVAVDGVGPRSVGRAGGTLRATLRVAPAAPSSRSACGGLLVCHADGCTACTLRRNAGLGPRLLGKASKHSHAVSGGRGSCVNCPPPLGADGRLALPMNLVCYSAIQTSSADSQRSPDKIL